jgi:transposase
MKTLRACIKTRTFSILIREGGMRIHTYPSDLTDAQWERISPYIPEPKSGTRAGGRPVTVNRREIVNAVFYLNKTGCQWRYLPTEFPYWSTVHTYYRLWRIKGIWKKIHEALRPQLRQQAGRNLQPSAGAIDSQSVKTTEKGGSRDTMRARKSKGESVILSSTRWD